MSTSFYHLRCSCETTRNVCPSLLTRPLTFLNTRMIRSISFVCVIPTRQRCSLFCETLFTRFSFVTTCFLTSLTWQHWKSKYWCTQACRLNGIFFLTWFTISVEKRLVFFLSCFGLFWQDFTKFMGKLHQCYTAMWREKKPEVPCRSIIYTFIVYISYIWCIPVHVR